MNFIRKIFKGIVYSILALFLFAIGYSFFMTTGTIQSEGKSSPNNKAKEGCSLSDISIKSVKARFENQCQASQCIIMKGIAVLTNRCADPIGIQIKITGYDKTGAPVATHDLWPASVKNILPGDYTFSLDQYLDYDPSIKKFDVIPIDIRHW
jgi:hypothetical protein